MAEPRTQAQRRRSFNNVDRFGRRWLLSIEIETGDPTGLITAAGWDDPLCTPQKYLRVPADAPRTIVILYARWIEDLKREHRDWNTQLDRVGQALYDTAYDETKPPTRRMLELVGSKPMPVALVERAARGDRGLLGLEPLKLKDARALGKDPKELERQRQRAAEMGDVYAEQGDGTSTPTGGQIEDGFRVPANDEAEEPA